jgi:choline dehydrogenase-like flavoprotein
VALLETFLPDECGPFTQAQQDAVNRVRQFSWYVLRDMPKVVELVRDFHRYYVTQQQSGGPWNRWFPFTKPSFADLPVRAREAYLRRMGESEDPEARRIAKMLCLVYKVVDYSQPFGPDLAGLKQPVSVDPNLKKLMDQATDWLPGRYRLEYKPATSTLELANGRPIDCLVIGSGPAGSVLAQQLRQGGRTVLLLDQGSLVVPGSLKTLSHPALLNGGGLQTCDDGSILFGSAKTVGGGTAVNADLAFPPTSLVVRQRIEAWRQDGLLGKNQFSPASIARAYAWVEKQMGTRQVQELEINANNRILWEGAAKAGIRARLYRLNEYPQGAAPSPVSLKRSALGQLLMGAMRDPANPLLLIPDTKVLRLLAQEKGDPKEVTGVEVEAQFPWENDGVWRDPLGLYIPPRTKYMIHAKNVFLCAGTLGSAALLLRSGFKNPEIGRGIVGHISIPVVGLFDHPINNTEGLSASVYSDHYALSHGIYFEAMSASPEYAALLMPGSVRQVFDFVRNFKYAGGFGVMLLDSPDPENRIYLDQQGNPQIHYVLSEADKARFRFGIEEAIRILFKAGAQKVVLPSSEVHPGGTQRPDDVYFTDPSQAAAVEKELHFIPNRTFLSSAHLQGSNKLGSDPQKSVVSSQLRLWGTKNLYVVDSSVFPTSVGANPMQSIYTVAKLFCEQWLKEHPKRRD